VEVEVDFCTEAADEGAWRRKRRRRMTAKWR
jgi:hypothetical protein